MSAPRRRPALAATGSVLDEMYGSAPAPDTAAPPVRPVSATPPPQVQPETDTPPTRVGHDSNTSTPTPRPVRASGTRTPPGRRRHTLYLAADVAADLDQAADSLVGELRGLVPRHVVLGALIRAGLAQSDAVSADLRAGLLRDLQP